MRGICRLAIVVVRVLAAGGGENEVQLIFAKSTEALPYSYYSDFERALRSVHASCNLYGSEPLCLPWENQTVSYKKRALVIPHYLTSNSTMLDYWLHEVEAQAANASWRPSPGYADEDMRRGRRVKLVVMVCLNKIYFGQTLEERLALIDASRKRMKRVPFLTTTWSSSAARRHSLAFVPFAVDADLFSVDGAVPYERRYFDVYFSGDLNPKKYPLRPDLVQAFNSSSHLRFLIPEKHLNSTEYVAALGSARMVLSTPGFPSTPSKPWFDLVGTRYFEVLATGASLLLCQRSPYYEELGIVENETAVMFDTVDEALSVATYFKHNPVEASRIILNGYRLARQRHLWRHRAEYVSDLLRHHFYAAARMQHRQQRWTRIFHRRMH